MNDTTLPLHELRNAARIDREMQGLPARPEKLLYLLRQDVLYATDVALHLFAYGYETVIADDLEQLIALVAARTPACVIVDSPDSGVALTASDAERIRIAGRAATLPILLISPRNNFEARLTAAKAGVDSYFTKPLDFTELTERLDGMTTFSDTQRGRVLMVCKDGEDGALYQGILSMAGMEVLRASRPADLLRMLDQFRPDAVLLDMDTPGCSAIDLTALMRQAGAFTDIPAIILSGVENSSFRQSALRSGADAVLGKPVSHEDLVFALLSRIERYRNLRGLIMRDRLTSLYNHTAFKEQLRREMARARRERMPLAYAMLDLDFFKQINDTHGHPVGDQVLRSIARLMRQRLRNGDVVGRYGGEEFGVILPNTTAAAAAEVLNEIRVEFQNLHHQGRDGDFCASFTAGVAEFGEGGESLDPLSLIRMADTALYQGKHAGRNRVELAKPML